jgi:L-lysine exporter family protein LysE/ArgO
MEQIHPLLAGILAGMALSVMLGTVFFSIVKNSIQSGWKSGSKIALGVVLCDIIFLTVVMAGERYISMLNTFEKEIAIVGGFFLILLGLATAFKKVTDNVETLNKNGTVKYMANGFLLNFLNPVNFAFWVSISTLLGSKWEYEYSDKMEFFSMAIVGIFATETGISILASKISRWMNPKRLRIMNYVVGAAFVLLGIKLILDYLQ